MKSDEQGFQTASAATENIEQHKWIKFLDEVTRQNRGAHARLTVVGAEVGSQIEAEDRPLLGISADTKAASITFP